jgi:hypothetical protein
MLKFPRFFPWLSHNGTGEGIHNGASEAVGLIYSFEDFSLDVDRPATGGHYVAGQL